MQALKQITLGIIIGSIGAALVLLIAAPPRGTAIALLPTSTRTPLTVYVSGEVAKPGLYTLAPGSRVTDALEAAGGTLPDAGLDKINLAQLLYDGQQIYVNENSDTAQTSEMTTEPVFPIDINTAAAEQLDQLPGIGPSKAQDIITYRQNNGAFDKIEQIMDVPGIGPSLFEKIKSMIVVSTGN